MFFFVSKLFAFVLSPMVWVFVLLILALVFFNNKKRGKRFLASAIILFFIFSNRFIADEAIRSWEVSITNMSDLDAHYDVGIVLGGGMVTNDGKLRRITFRKNVDRILQAVELYKEQRIGKILISGGAGNLLYPDVLEAVLLKDYLIKIGLPAQDILVDSLSNNTRENAVNCALILNQAYPNGKFLLITSSLQMRRAKACFNKVGIKTTIYATNKLVGDRRYQLDYLLLPDPAGFFACELFLHEFLGYGVYKLIGYI